MLNMLQGNVAFVVNSRWCWNLTQREEMRSAPVYNESGEMVIPTETINQLFNVSLPGEYAGGQQIADVLKTWEVFTDPRGFMIFSHDIGSVIDTAPAIEGNIAYRHYRSYYNVQAAIAKITWNDINPTKEDWAYARRRAYLALTLPEGEVGEYEDRYIRELAATVSPYLDTVTLGEDVTVPFSDCTLYNSFQRIVEMARPYAILRDKGRTDVDPERLKTAALGVFNFLADRWIGRNASMDSNWFYNRITYPLAMAEFMILMYDEMEYARICEVTADLMVRVGSNLVSTGQVPFQYYTDGTPGEPDRFLQQLYQPAVADRNELLRLPAG